MHRVAFAQSRRASTSAGHAFPYPKHERPTPHQIFHLPVGASQQDIKARYYDLVRVHHPDSPHGRDIPQKVRHARFQSITRAYDILRGVRSEHDEHDADPMLREILRRKRMYEAHQREEARRREMRRRASAELRPEHDAEADGHAAETAELRLKDAVIVAAAALAVGAAIAPTLFNLSMADHTHRAAAANLAQARREAREFGHERRKEIRRRVQEYREQEEREASQAEDSASCTWQRERRA